MQRNTVSLLVGAVLGTAIFFPAAPASSTTQVPLPVCTAPAPVPTLIARAAYVEDVATGTMLYEHASDVQLPIASLTKLLTVLAAVPLLGDTVRISDESLLQYGDDGLKAGDRWNTLDLARFVLIESSNDGAQALADAAIAAEPGAASSFIDLMNRRAAALGLTQTYALTPTGLDVSQTVAGGYGSARDMAHLIVHAARTLPSVTDRTTEELWPVASENGHRYRAHNTTALPGVLPGAIASKTGYTDLARGNLAILIEALPGRPVAIAVLGSTREGRELDAALLAEYARAELRRRATCSL